MLEIERQLLPEFIETADFRRIEKLLQQRPSEPFHFSIGLRMVGAADRMLDLVVAQIGSELVVPGPAFISHLPPCSEKSVTRFYKLFKPFSRNLAHFMQPIHISCGKHMCHKLYKFYKQKNA